MRTGLRCADGLLTIFQLCRTLRDILRPAVLVALGRDGLGLPHPYDHRDRWRSVPQGGAHNEADSRQRYDPLLLSYHEDPLTSGDDPVLSFVGVILIARPEFLFGKRAEDASGAARIVTPSQRLGAVGYVRSLRTHGRWAESFHYFIHLVSLC